MIQGKRGDTAATLWWLLEIILSIVIITTIGYIMADYANSNTFFQSFFAKDNAYMIDALQSVPNGQAQIGYLWYDPKYTIAFEQSKAKEVAGSYVSVDLAKVEAKSQVQKYHAESGQTKIATLDPFNPIYFYYSLNTAQAQRSITITGQFSETKCPASNGVINGLSLTAQTTTFDSSALETFGKDITSAIVTNRGAINSKFSETGFEIELIAEKGPLETTEVYYTQNTDASIRMACTIAQSLSKDSAVRYGHISEGPQITTTANVVVIINSQSQTAITDKAGELKQGILGYWEAQ